VNEIGKTVDCVTRKRLSAFASLRMALTIILVTRPKPAIRCDLDLGRLTTRASRFHRAFGRRILDPADNGWRWTRKYISRNEYQRRTTSKTALHNPSRADLPCRERSGGRDDSTRRDENRIFITTVDRAIGWSSVEKSKNERIPQRRSGRVARNERMNSCRRFRETEKSWTGCRYREGRREKRSFLSFFLFCLRSLLTASRAQCGLLGGRKCISSKPEQGD